MADLTKMSDQELGEWQVQYKVHTEQYIRAEKEWGRRQLAHQFNLQKKLDESNNQWSFIVACIGAVGALLGAVVGALITHLLSKQ